MNSYPRSVGERTFIINRIRMFVIQTIVSFVVVTTNVDIAYIC